MDDLWTSRTELLLGHEKLDLLKRAHVLVVGLGGVGAYAAETICRAGVGQMTIVDGDVVNESNLNRQLIGLHSTIGLSKADVLAKRLKDINPDLNLTVLHTFIADEATTELLNSARFDYVVDGIDTLSPKVYLLYHAYHKGLKIVSSMGAGGKVDPSKIKIADISKTETCALARNVRKRLAKLGVTKGIEVVFSTEEACKQSIRESNDERNKRSVIGTISYLPPVFGCYLAFAVLKGLLKE